MTHRFDKTFKIREGFLLETQYKGRFLYLDPITGETLKRSDLYHSTGYPGSTLWYRANLPGRENPPPPLQPKVHDANLSLDGEGFLIIKMKDGRIIDHGKTRRLVHMTKDIERFRAFMNDQINRMNSDVKTLLDVHLEAAAPDAPRVIHPEVFFEPYPDQYITSRLWFFGLVTVILLACFALPNSEQPFLLAAGLAAAAIAMLALRIKGIKDYNKRIDQWEKRKTEFDQNQQEFLKEWNDTCSAAQDQDAILGLALEAFDWPRETNASWEFKNGCKELHLDIDLPRWLDLPAQTWKTGRDGVTLERGLMSHYARQERYVRHVHSLLFLAASAAFWSTPGLDTLYLSGFCKNYTEPEPSTEPAHTEPKTKRTKKSAAGSSQKDTHLEAKTTPEMESGEPVYLISVKIDRTEWAQTDFNNLEKLDPVSALNKFEMRRELNVSTMVLSRIEPLD